MRMLNFHDMIKTVHIVYKKRSTTTTTLQQQQQNNFLSLNNHIENSILFYRQRLFIANMSNRPNCSDDRLARDSEVRRLVSEHV